MASLRFNKIFSHFTWRIKPRDEMCWQEDENTCRHCLTVNLFIPARRRVVARETLNLNKIFIKSYARCKLSLSLSPSLFTLFASPPTSFSSPSFYTFIFSSVSFDKFSLFCASFSSFLSAFSLSPSLRIEFLSLFYQYLALRIFFTFSLSQWGI